MYPTRAQPHGRPLPADAANAPSHAEQSPTEQCLDYAAWLSAGRWLGQLAANDLSTHYSKTAALSENYRSETIGQSDCRPIVRLLADTIVRWDYRPNPTSHCCVLLMHYTWCGFVFICVPEYSWLNDWFSSVWFAATTDPKSGETPDKNDLVKQNSIVCFLWCSAVNTLHIIIISNVTVTLSSSSVKLLL